MPPSTTAAFKLEFHKSLATGVHATQIHSKKSSDRKTASGIFKVILVIHSRLKAYKTDLKVASI